MSGVQPLGHLDSEGEEGEALSEVLLTVAQAAGYLQCHPQTVRGYIKSDRLAHVKVGRQYRIRLEDLQAGVQPVERASAPTDGKFRSMARSM